MHNTWQKFALPIISTTVLILCILVGYFLFLYNTPGVASHVVSHSTSHAAPLLAKKVATIDGYQKRVFTNNQGHTLPYYFYQPTHYSPAHKYPLVLLLHGGGERAQPHNTPAQNRYLLFKQDYVKVWSDTYTGAHNPNIQEHWPAFIVVPQVMIPHQWINTPSRKGSYKQAPQPTPELLMAKQLIDSLQKQYPDIDPHRLYITGVSQGGYGTWDMIERWPHYFAAAAPISGAGDPAKAGLLKNLPVWAFHGAKDPICTCFWYTPDDCRHESSR
ncbi:alpha/beta hydrolase-fold protein [Dictyobacter formicarum]|uniref:Phospholipase n=1 Tax=Dictyobacter formicarum TaxID=2778368 RepID=A0ABQ3VM36_9CHLR|nr:alpha/beta hydrolase-fold protein [Dictyobacter formicarum]GHO86146.1 phospholipase [Dictyobacter formicarum]